MEELTSKFHEDIALKTELTRKRSQIINSVLTNGLIPNSILKGRGVDFNLRSCDTEPAFGVEGAEVPFNPEGNSTSINYVLHRNDIVSCIPVVCERESESYPPRGLLKKFNPKETRAILEKRAQASFMVCAPREGRPVKKEGMEVGKFISVLFPQEILDQYRENNPLPSVRYECVNTISKMIKFHNEQPIELVVPNYQGALETLMREREEGIWLHAVRLPTEEDLTA